MKLIIYLINQIFESSVPVIQNALLCHYILISLKLKKNLSNYPNDI